MPAHFCKTCTAWAKAVFTRGDKSFGICNNNDVALRVSMDTEQRAMLEDDGVLYTDEYFGCVFWREKNNILFDLGDIIDQKTGKPK
jgi:hypothetical protein